MTNSLRRVVRSGVSKVVWIGDRLLRKERETDRVGRLAVLGAYKPLLVLTFHLAFFSPIFSGPDRPMCVLWAASCICVLQWPWLT